MNKHGSSSSSSSSVKTHPDPRRGKEFDQVLPTITTWAEVENVIFVNYPEPQDPCKAHFSFFLAAVRYAFFEQRSAVVMCIRRGRIALAYQVANENFRNRWSRDLDLIASAERLVGAPITSRPGPAGPAGSGTESKDGSGSGSGSGAAGPSALQTYEIARGKVGAGDEMSRVLPDPSSWWLNGRVVCNIPTRNVWGDFFVRELLEYVSAVCERNPDIEFDVLLNRRDCAMLPKASPLLASPYPFHEVVRCLSFYTSENHLDKPMPVVEDWLHICGKTPHPRSKADWEARLAKAVFRGSSTGHACSELNVRVRLARLGREYPELLDSTITSVCCRDGIVADHRAEGGHRKIIIATQSRRDLSHLIAPQMTMQTQFDRYRYVIYAPGHSAASRYGALLGSGCAIIRVSDPSCPCPDVWFEKELRAASWTPGERRLGRAKLEPEDADHICATVFDTLGGHGASCGSISQAVTWLRENNALARMIAENARKKYDRIMTVEYAEACFIFR